MGWSVPPTFVTGQVVTAAQLNILSGDLTDLDSRTRPVGAQITGSSTTASTTYTDLVDAVGPFVSVVTGTAVIVALSAETTNSLAGGSCFMSVAVSGATTLVASNQNARRHTIHVASDNQDLNTRLILLTGLTAGTNTFTAKYQVNGGTGSFQNRFIIVWPANNLS